ncbi:MAG: hypothetical protein J6K19_00210 [Prevotella sp.]|nr:hypothetical protein [Prevotella sp.]
MKEIRICLQRKDEGKGDTLYNIRQPKGFIGEKDEKARERRIMGGMGITEATGGGGSGGKNRERAEKKKREWYEGAWERRELMAKKIERSRFEDARSML